MVEPEDGGAGQMSEGAPAMRAMDLSGGRAAPTYVAAIFLSAWLIFGVQPLFTKMVLPILGGAPNVWNVAMVFFQATLLGGYCYAHILSTRFSLRWQVRIHLAVMAAGALFLPFAVPPGAAPPPSGGQALWQISMMAGAIGLPFFALSANAPLLQRWFSHTSHPSAHDPYFLYAASNIGSMASLLLYPIALEPLIGVRDQSSYWAFAYLALIAAIGAASIFAAPAKQAHSAPAAANAAPRLGQNGPLWWTIIAIAPSGLMLSVTTHLTMNVTPTPLLWVAPLALYLLSFVLVFGRRGEFWRRTATLAFPIIVGAATLSYGFFPNEPPRSALLPLALFFVTALACHGELARRRPEAARLTQFYLCMSLGGVVGGAFVALAAPLLFPDVFEYPLLVIAAAFVISACNGGLERRAGAMAAAAVAAVAFGLIAGRAPASLENAAVAAGSLVAFACAFGAFRLRMQAMVMTACVAALFANAMAVRALMSRGDGEMTFRERSFFGVIKVFRLDTEEGPVHALLHGVTIHNYQFRNESLQDIPLAYFSKAGPFGQTFEAARARYPEMRVAVVGLGAGALACYADGTGGFTFYEIDPLVEKIARDPSHFSYLSRCAPDAPVVIGDARLAFAAERKQGAPKFDLIIIDAFSSDSIPAHLITREALALYRDRLNDDGVILFHTSNRYLDVNSVALRIAAGANLGARVIRFNPESDGPSAKFVTTTTAVIVGRADVIEAMAAGRAHWRAETPSPLVREWTDDYSNIVSAMAAVLMKKTAGEP